MASQLIRLNIRRCVYSSHLSDPSKARLCVPSRPYFSAPFFSDQAMGGGLGPGSGLLFSSSLLGLFYWTDLFEYRSAEANFNARCYRLMQENALDDLNEMQREIDAYKVKRHERSHKDKNASGKVQSAKQAE